MSTTVEPTIETNLFDPLMQDDLDSHIIEDLRPLARDISDLLPDPTNARRHDARNLVEIASSMRDHGVRTPLVVNKRTMYIEKGNGTYMAARMLGWTRLPIVFTNDDENEAMTYGIRDNRTGELASWNYRQTGENMRALQDAGQPLLTLGFNEAESIPFLIGDFQPATVTDEEFNPDAQKGRAIKNLTAPQRARIDEAVARFRSSTPKPVSEGQALAVICTDYVARNGGAATVVANGVPCGCLAHECCEKCCTGDHTQHQASLNNESMTEAFERLAGEAGITLVDVTDKVVGQGGPEPDLLFD